MYLKSTLLPQIKFKKREKSKNKKLKKEKYFKKIGGWGERKINKKTKKIPINSNPVAI